MTPIAPDQRNFVSFDIHSASYGTHRVLIDEADLLLVAGLQWHIARSSKKPHALYVRASACGTLKVSLHRLLLNAAPGVDVDHINCNALDNRRINLRSCTRRENNWNVARLRTNTSGYKGVSWHRGTHKWQAYYSHQDHRCYIGLFDSPEEAHAAYVAAVTPLRGEFVRTA